MKFMYFSIQPIIIHQEIFNGNSNLPIPSAINSMNFILKSIWRSRILDTSNEVIPSFVRTLGNVSGNLKIKWFVSVSVEIIRCKITNFYLNFYELFSVFLIGQTKYGFELILWSRLSFSCQLIFSIHFPHSQTDNDWAWINHMQWHLVRC